MPGRGSAVTNKHVFRFMCGVVEMMCVVVFFYICFSYILYIYLLCCKFANKKREREGVVV